MFILLFLIFDLSVSAFGKDSIEDAMKMLELETIENLRNIQKLLENSNMAESVDTTKLLTVYKEVFEKQSESLNLVMKMLTSKNNSRCGLNNQEDDEGRLLEVTTCHCVPTPPAGTGLQVSSIVYDCRDTNSSYAVTCSQGDCSTHLWPQCGDDNEENNEADDTDEDDDGDDDGDENTSLGCGAGLKSRGVKRLVGQGVFSQEEQLPCQECDQQLFQWSTWSTVGDKMVRHRGSNRIIDSYQEEERTGNKFVYMAILKNKCLTSLSLQSV